MTEISGSTALVTGATGGLGRAIATALAREGANVVVSGSGRRLAELETLARTLGGRAVAADLALPAEVERLLEETGQVDVAVMNAGVAGTGDLLDWTQEKIERILAVNLTAPIAITRALLPGMRERDRGHLVYISSLSGKVGSKGTSLYSATKFGLRGFASGLRCDLLGSGIGCSVVSPGFVRDAGMFANAGATLPPGVGTSTSAEVAGAVVKAVRTNRPEIVVAPAPMKLASTIGMLAPRLSEQFQARFGGDTADQLATARREQPS